MTLGQLTGQLVSEENFADDRLSVVLKYVSDPRYWHPIEEELARQTIRAYDLPNGVVRYDLPNGVVRCDAATGRAFMRRERGGFQFGHSKDDPTLAQIKLMSGTQDPLGLPLATDVVSGEQADEATLVARIEKILTTQKVEELFTVSYERQVKRRMKQVGRGRGGPGRQHEEIERIRYQITSI